MDHRPHVDGGAEAPIVGQVEDLVLTWTLDVGVDDQHVQAGLSDDHGQIGRER